MEWIENVLRDVAELPDRNSPEDWPEAMLVTGAELRQIIVAHAPAEPVNIDFGMRGENMFFQIGNQSFLLDYKPEEQGEFEFMQKMLLSAFSSITHGVKTESQPVNARILDALKRAKDSLVAFKFVPEHANCWEASDEENLTAVNSAIARAEAALAEPQPDADDPWKSAVIEQLVMAHTITAEHESDPLKAVQDLLAYHADIAVDPRVSGAAANLVEQAKAEEREACAKVCESERDAFNENLQVWQENPTLTPCDEFISDWDSEAKIGEQYAAAIRARGNK